MRRLLIAVRKAWTRFYRPPVLTSAQVLALYKIKNEDIR